MKQKEHKRFYKTGKMADINKGYKKKSKNIFKKIFKKQKPSISEEEKIINDIKTFKKNLTSHKSHDFMWLPGNGNVILSAPHAVRHFRRVLVKDEEQKEKIKEYTKGSDEYTGGIVYALNKLTRMPGIILTRPGSWDPNLYDGVPYKLSIKNHSEGKILLLDIHGARLDRPFDVAIGTIDGESLLEHPGYLDNLIKHLKNEGIKPKINVKGFDAGEKQHTVTRYASHILKIPAIQIEINERYRNPYSYPENVVKLIKALEEFLIE